MSDSAAIVLEHLHKSYGTTPVLRGLSLQVTPGERLALIGPSGSGKSTVLRMVVGLDDPNQGVVKIHGQTVFDSARDPKRVPYPPGSIGMVFQHFNLFPHMTVLDNLCLAPKRVLGRAAHQAEARARELLQSVGLQDKANSKPATLSGGQKQRVAIARALAMEPRIMLFDEITSALDPETVGEVLSVLRQLAETTTMTMVLVTHQLAFARQFATRIAFVADGTIIEDGTPAAVLDSPRTDRVTQFVRALLP